MSKISNTSAYPIETPESTDLFIFTDISDLKSTKNARLSTMATTIKDSFYILEDVELQGTTASKIKTVYFPEGTTIIDSSFKNSEFTSVTLPSGLITIEDYAFQNSKLTSVIIPDTVTSIGSAAFNGNTSLTTVNIPSGVTNIGSDAFIQTDLTFADLIIPESCSVGSDAFFGLEVTTTLTVLNNASLGSRSFGSGTLNNIVIGDNVSGGNTGISIIDGPFENAVINGNVSIGDNINFNSMYWFDDVTGTATAVSFGPNFSNSDGAFFKAPFTSYTFTGNPVNTIPDGVTLGTAMFQQSDITSLNVGDNVNVGIRAFYLCFHVTSLTLGSNVTMIPNGTLNADNFNNLAVGVLGGIPVTIPGTTTLAIGSFRYANISSLTIQSGVTEIPQNCFQSLTTPGSITSLSIPSTVLTFGQNCFFNQQLPGLTTLTLGSAGNPVTIGQFGFFHAVDLTTVNLPTGSTYDTQSFPIGATINFY